MVRKNLLIALIILLWAMNVLAGDKYKKFQYQKQDNYFLKVSFSQKDLTFTLYGDDTTKTFTFNEKEIVKADHEIYVKENQIVNDSGFILSGEIYPISLIDKVDIKSDESESNISFLKKSGGQKSRFYSKKKNRISAFDKLTIPISIFVRGSAISFWSDIEVNGEVNEDVVAIFGDVTIGNEAVIRGNVAAIGGMVHVAKNATIYGEIMSYKSGDKYDFKRKRRYYRNERYFSPYGRFSYNRVDGAAPYLGVRFIDEDSLLPQIKLYGGYGFASERWRYGFELEQLIIRERPLIIGGSVYKRLASDDNWIVSETHNTIFALLATEDYKDYYEAEGGYIYIKDSPVKNLTLETGFLFEKHRWLQGHPELWSLFGGSKLFPYNFSGVSDLVRLEGISEINSKKISSVIGRINYSTGKSNGHSNSSYWNGNIEIEWLPGQWNHDYDFTRWFISVNRQQEISRHLMILAGGAFGDSDGHLPMHRWFYLGGYGTLLGYKHKEFYGNKFWAGNFDGGIIIPRTEIILWFFYNTGVAAPEDEKLSDSEIKQSIGLGISYENSIRLNIARRLDNSESSFKLNISLGLSF